MAIARRRDIRDAHPICCPMCRVVCGKRVGLGCGLQQGLPMAVHAVSGRMPHPDRKVTRHDRCLWRCGRGAGGRYFGANTSCPPIKYCSHLCRRFLGSEGKRDACSGASRGYRASLRGYTGSKRRFVLLPEGLALALRARTRRLSDRPRQKERHRKIGIDATRAKCRWPRQFPYP